MTFDATGSPREEAGPALGVPNDDPASHREDGFDPV